MPFTVEEFLDLVRLLEQQPEWRVELRRLLLTEDVLALPRVVRELSGEVRALAEAQRRTEECLTRLEQVVEQLAEAQRRTEQRVEELTEAQRRTEERLTRLEQVVEQLAEAQRRTEERVEELAEAQRRTEERLTRLEQVVEQLAEAQRRTEQRVEELAEAQRRTEQRVEELAEAQRRTEERVEELADAQRRTEEAVTRLTQRVDSLSQDVSYLNGAELERRYRERAPAYFQRLALGLYVLPFHELSELLYRAMQEGKLTQDEYDDIMQVDVVARGRRRDDGTPVYLVVEVSWGVGPHDVERAARRAKPLASVVGAPTIPVVAGRTITYEAESMADDLGVWQVLDGRVTAPGTSRYSLA